MIRPFAAMGIAAMALSPALAQGFSAGETEAMNRALLTYSLTWPGNYLYDNKRGFDFYLNLQGNDPSPQFLDSFGAASGKLKPYSRAQAVRANGSEAHPGVMTVDVSAFHSVAPDTVQAFVDAHCGMVCGGQNVVTLQKFGDAWEVTSFKTTSME